MDRNSWARDVGGEKSSPLENFWQLPTLIHCYQLRVQVTGSPSFHCHHPFPTNRCDLGAPTFPRCQWQVGLCPRQRLSCHVLVIVLAIRTSRWKFLLTRQLEMRSRKDKYIEGIAIAVEIDQITLSERKSTKYNKPQVCSLPNCQ